MERIDVKKCRPVPADLDTRKRAQRFRCVKGTVQSRTVVHKKGLLHSAVLVLVFDGKDNIYVQQRSRKKDVFPGLYEASLSGHVRHGESDLVAAVRELREELSLVVTKAMLRRLFTTTVQALPEYENITVFEIVTNKMPVPGEEVKVGTFMPIGMLLALAGEKGIFTPVFSALLPRLRPLLEKRETPQSALS